MTYYRALASAPSPPESSDNLFLTEIEIRALQRLADRHGLRWRTKLFAAYRDGTLDEPLMRLMDRPHAGNHIARTEIIPRSLPPVAAYYGPLYLF